MNATEAKTAALAAIQRLRTLAVHGDTEAAADLLEVATSATGHLEALARHPPDRPAPAALRRMAGVSMQWPVNVPAIEENRAQAILAALPEWFGLTGPIRTTKGKTRPRDFHPESRTGFTLRVIADLRAAHAFPWMGDADDITAACMDQLDADCQGDWEKNFPWPPLLIDEAIREAHRSNPRRHVAERWIRAGLKSLQW